MSKVEAEEFTVSESAVVVFKNIAELIHSREASFTDWVNSLEPLLDWCSSFIVLVVVHLVSEAWIGVGH